MKNQNPKFDDFLKLDAVTMMDYFTIGEVKELLKLEPYNQETISYILDLIESFVESEEYLWCAMFKKELDRREELTLI